MENRYKSLYKYLFFFILHFFSFHDGTWLDLNDEVYTKASGRICNFINYPKNKQSLKSVSDNNTVILNMQILLPLNEPLLLNLDALSPQARMQQARINPLSAS